MIAVVYDKNNDYASVGQYWLAGVPAVGDHIQISVLTRIERWEVVSVTFIAKHIDYHVDGRPAIAVNAVLI